MFFLTTGMFLLGGPGFFIMHYSFVCSHFMHCPLAYNFFLNHPNIRLITNYYNIDYKFLLNEAGNSMVTRRMHTLALEIFKTLNNPAPNFMSNIFIFSLFSTHRKHIFVHSRSASNYADRDLKALGPNTWNSLPENIKSISCIFIFKDFIKSSFWPKCKWKLCL